MDQELSAKFESELRMEKEMRDSETLPANIQEFLDNSDFQVRNCHKMQGYRQILIQTINSSKTPLAKKKSS